MKSSAVLWHPVGRREGKSTVHMTSQLTESVTVLLTLNTASQMELHAMSGMRIKGFQLVPATEEHSTERYRSPDACSNCYRSTTAVKVPIPVHMQLAGL